jgi:opacity protein-like surface antigen
MFCLGASGVLAGSMGSIEKPDSLGFVGIEGGWLQADVDGDMQIRNGSQFRPPLNRDRYTLHKADTGLFGIQLGYRQEIPAQYIPAWSVALRYRQSFSSNWGGTVYQYSLPQFDNYRYSLAVESAAFLIQGKLALIDYNHWKPWISAGAGIAFNRASEFRETAYPGVIPRLSPAFTGHTSSQFSWNTGAGIDWHLSAPWLVSAWYEYQDNGKLATGKGTRLWSSQSLTVPSYRANAAIIGLSYLFDSLV